MSKQDVHEGEYHFKYETDEAILCSTEQGQGGNEFWLPKSKITYSRSNTGRKVTVVVPQWLAEVKGLV